MIVPKKNLKKNQFYTLLLLHHCIPNKGSSSSAIKKKKNMMFYSRRRSKTSYNEAAHVLIGLLSLSFIGFLLIIQDPPLIHTSLPGIVIESSDSNNNNRRFLRENELKYKNRRRIRNDDEVFTTTNELNDGSSNDVIGNNELSNINDAVNTELNDLVHIVNTRFMQMQGNLTNLGQARLEIFKHFCLPTMVHQTVNFLWIIRTDPNLNLKIKTQMIELLKPYPNFMLVENNNNPEYFREVTDIVNKTQVTSGSIDIARRYLEASKDRYVLETRLDSDDGLASQTLEQLQISAKSTFSTDERVKGKEKSWTVWCLDRTIEWHMKYYKNRESSGLIIPHISDMCLTPSLTVGFPPGVVRSDVPTMKHQKLHKVIPTCAHMEETKCMRKIISKSDLTSGAIRVRSPTSSGMSNVLSVPKSIEDKWGKYQDKFWKTIPTTFSIEKSDADYMNEYLSKNIRFIAEDNLKGQCTKGHSCKQESKEKLKQIIEIVTKAIE